MRWLALACAALVVGTAGAARADDSGRIVGSVMVSPLSVDVTRPDDAMRKGRWFDVVARVTNTGPKRLEDVEVTLVRPSGLRLRGPSIQTIRRIPSGDSRRERWEVCSNAAGSYVVLVRAAVDVFTAESAGHLVEIVPSNRTC